VWFGMMLSKLGFQALGLQDSPMHQTFELLLHLKELFMSSIPVMLCMLNLKFSRSVRIHRILAREASSMYSYIPFIHCIGDGRLVEGVCLHRHYQPSG
jgi:hypothetical protein